MVEKAAPDVNIDDIEPQQTMDLDETPKKSAGESASLSSQEPSDADGPAELDWDTLKRTELHEKHDSSQTPIDTTALRERLQRVGSLRDNKRDSQISRHSRQSSLQKIRRSVVENVSANTDKLLTPKPNNNGHARNESKEILLTELELWTALVSDYTQTAVRLPTLTSRKIRAGIPQPLRGLVWQAMSGARETHLEGLYETLTDESTPFEKVIGRDLARTFPQVEMFKEEGGAGQLDLGKVLRAFSLYDAEVGYCQGLGFIVAPLLMNMQHSEAFCVLVRLMEGYELRSMFTPTLSGLKLRLYQFEQLLETTAPSLAAHLQSLDIFPAMYASQWFLSLFAVTCPLQTLHRIYDLLLAEGAPETMMRLAMTLLIKNQDLIMTLEMEGVLHLLLSSELWAAYDGEDDLVINDVVSFTTSITSEILADLQRQFESSTVETPLPHTKGLQSIASSFLGRIKPSRLFSGSFSSMPDMKSVGMSRTPSKMSSLTVESVASISPCTENGGEDSSNSSFSRSSMLSLKRQTESLEKENKQLNQQIEDLIDALGSAHKDVAILKEEQDNQMGRLDELKMVASELLLAFKTPADDSITEGMSSREWLLTHWMDELTSLLGKDPLSPPAQISVEKIKFLETQLDDRNVEVGRMRSSLQSVKSALEATQKDKIRLEKALNDVRQQKRQTVAEAGIRELKLGRPGTSRASSQTRVPEAQTGTSKVFRRASAFAAGSPPMQSAATSPVEVSPANTSPLLSMTEHEEELDALRLELVQAKASIAIAQQEAEEAKYALRMQRNFQAQQTHVKRASISRTESAPAAPDSSITNAAASKAEPETPSSTTSTTSSWFWKR